MVSSAKLENPELDSDLPINVAALYQKHNNLKVSMLSKLSMSSRFGNESSVLSFDCAIGQNLFFKVQGTFNDCTFGSNEIAANQQNDSGSADPRLRP